MSIDLLKIVFSWFNGTKELANYKLDTLREYFGITKEGAHRALKDVEDTGAILMRFLKYKKNTLIRGGLKLKGCFKQEN
jgi:DNA polymerase III alpha subunit (gram-positive type)